MGVKHESEREFKIDLTFLSLLVAYMIALFLAITVAKKLVILPFGMSASAGTVLGYAFCFVITDIVSEIYGYKASRIIVRFGLIAFVSFVTLTQISIILPTSNDWANQESFSDVLAVPLKLFIAWFAAYWLSQYADVWIYHKVKNLTQGKMLWLRNNLSTLVAQFIDSITWPTIMFLGVMPLNEIMGIVSGEYTVKLCVALLDTAVLYIVIKLILKNKLKKT